MPAITSKPLHPEPIALQPEKGAVKHDMKKIASQFEAVLIGQLLKLSHGADGQGWFGTGGDEAGSSLMGMAEEQLAQALSSQGGLGLSKLVMQGMEKDQQVLSKESLAKPIRGLDIKNK